MSLATAHEARNPMQARSITCLARAGKALLAGTFVGGLASYSGGTWRAVRETRGLNVTGIAIDDYGGAYIATRGGVWYQNAAGTMKEVRGIAGTRIDEAQAVMVDGTTLWVGTRTGLYRLSAMVP